MGRFTSKADGGAGRPQGEALPSTGRDVADPAAESPAIGVHRFRVAPRFVPPAIVEDTREQTPLPFDALPSANRLPVVRAALEVGDYTADGLEADLFVERKSVSDLVGSVTHDRARFVRELDFALAMPFRWRVLLIVGDNPSMSCARQMESGAWRSLATPESVRASVNAFRARYGLAVLYCDSPLQAAGELVGLVRYYARHLANARWTQRGFHASSRKRP